MDKIKFKKPCSRCYLFVKKYFLVFLLSIFIVFTTYIISLLFFSIKESNLTLLFNGGISGLEIFINSLPWMLIILSLILIFSINSILRSGSHFYRKPIIYTLLIVSLFIIGGGYTLAKTSLNKNLEQKQIPVIKDVYKNYIKRQARNSFVGRITDINGNKVKVKNNQGEDIQIEFKGKGKLNKDDSVLIINKKGKGRFIEIHKIQRQRNNSEIK